MAFRYFIHYWKTQSILKQTHVIKAEQTKKIHNLIENGFACSVLSKNHHICHPKQYKSKRQAEELCQAQHILISPSLSSCCSVMNKLCDWFTATQPYSSSPTSSKYACFLVSCTCEHISLINHPDLVSWHIKWSIYKLIIRPSSSSGKWVQLYRRHIIIRSQNISEGVNVELIEAWTIVIHITGNEWIETNPNYLII